MQTEKGRAKSKEKLKEDNPEMYQDLNIVWRIYHHHVDHSLPQNMCSSLDVAEKPIAHIDFVLVNYILYKYKCMAQLKTNYINFNMYFYESIL